MKLFFVIAGITEPDGWLRAHASLLAAEDKREALAGVGARP
jgi:hypothetical protein